MTDMDAAELEQQATDIWAELDNDANATPGSLDPEEAIPTIMKQLRQVHEKGRQAGRKTALVQAARDVCMYCDGRAVGYDAAEGPNSAGNWTHTTGGNPDTEVMCKASSIFSRMHYEALKDKPEGGHG